MFQEGWPRGWQDMGMYLHCHLSNCVNLAPVPAKPFVISTCHVPIRRDNNYLYCCRYLHHVMCSIHSLSFDLMTTSLSKIRTIHSIQLHQFIEIFTIMFQEIWHDMGMLYHCHLSNCVNLAPDPAKSFVISTCHIYLYSVPTRRDNNCLSSIYLYHVMYCIHSMSFCLMNVI